jgi:hypothetical protein
LAHDDEVAAYSKFGASVDISIDFQNNHTVREGSRLLLEVVEKVVETVVETVEKEEVKREKRLKIPHPTVLLSPSPPSFSSSGGRGGCTGHQHRLRVPMVVERWSTGVRVVGVGKCVDTPRRKSKRPHVWPDGRRCH